MKHTAVQDVSHLPNYAFGTKSPIWWGTLGFVALEGVGFALAVGAYFYLRQVNGVWPVDAPAPTLWAGTANLILLLASIVPNAIVDRDACAMNLKRVRIGLVIMSVIGVASLGFAPSSSRSSTSCGTATPTVRSCGSRSGCTPCTWLRILATRWC